MTRDEIIAGLRGALQAEYGALPQIIMLTTIGHQTSVLLSDVLQAAIAELQERDALAAEIAGWVELGEEMRRLLENDVLIADWFAPRLYAACEGARISALP